MRRIVLAAALSVAALSPRAAHANDCEARAERIVRWTGAAIDERGHGSISLMYNADAFGLVTLDCENDGINNRTTIGGVYPTSNEFWAFAGVAGSIATDASSEYINAGGRDCLNRARGSSESADGYRSVEEFARGKFDISCEIIINATTHGFLLHLLQKAK